MKKPKSQILDLVMLVVVITNFVLFFTTTIPPSAFLIVLAICAAYTYFIRKYINA